MKHSRNLFAISAGSLISEPLTVSYDQKIKITNKDSFVKTTVLFPPIEKLVAKSVAYELVVALDHLLAPHNLKI